MDTIPGLTTKKNPPAQVFEELQVPEKGLQRKDLTSRGVNIWDEWAFIGRKDGDKEEHRLASA